MPRADRNAAIGLVTSWLTGLSSGHFRARQVTSPHTDIEVVDRGTGRTIPLKVAVREFSQSDREGKNFQIRKAVLCPARDGIIVLLYLNDDALRQRGELESKLEGKADVADLARRRSTIARQLDRAREQERSYAESLASLENGLADRREKVSRLSELRKSISAARSEGVGRIEAALSGNGGPDIGITMSPNADATKYEEWLTSKLKGVKPYQARDRIIAALKASFGPDGTAGALLQGTAPGSGLREGDVDILRDAIFPFAEDAGSGVQSVRPEVLSTVLECDECSPDDRVNVTLDGKPIADLSPGQRCSALLPIILLGSKAPLVLDQPEDNLDNQLITDLLIRTLHGLKEHRQVIVVTHNPNIVVTGDAEQVVVMEATDGKCRVRRQASVDRIDVMRDIVDLMEGGKEGLRRRFRRYWPEEQVPELSFLEDAE